MRSHGTGWRGKRGLDLLVTAAMLCASLQAGIVVISDTARAYALHQPIRINGNAEFTPANGVVGGSGTSADPFLIEGWEINASTADGISIANTDAHVAIRNCYIHSDLPSSYGIYFQDVYNATLEDNSLKGNRGGLGFLEAFNIGVTANNFSDNRVGINAVLASNVTISSNNVWSSSYYGIYLQSSPGTTVRDNFLVNSTGSDIYLSSTDEDTLVNNTMISDGGSRSGGVFISGNLPHHYDTHTITSNNTLNGKPILYYKDCGNEVVDGVSAGQLIVANCTDIRVANMTMGESTLVAIEMAFTDGAVVTDSVVSNGSEGIFLMRSANVTVVSNVAFNNSYGIDLMYSANATVTGNTAVSNDNGLSVWLSNYCTVAGNNVSDSFVGVSTLLSSNVTIIANNISRSEFFGIELSSSTDVAVYHNNLVNNTNQAFDEDGPGNRWDNGYPSGGNYWSNYAGPDFYKGVNQNLPGSDGVGDVPLAIDADSIDKYPLMVPYGVFDTSPPTIVIASPKEGQAFTTSSIIASGSSSDAGGSGLGRVEVSTNGGTWEIVSGTYSWSHPVVLRFGPNLIEARAWDMAGNPSPTVSVNVTLVNTPPSASFTVVPAQGNVTTTFLVDASSSSDLEDSTAALEVRWDWENDSVWDTPFSTTKTNQHRYSAPGNYTIDLEVRDTGGLINSTTRQLTVTSDSAQATLPLEPENLQALSGYGQVNLAWNPPSSDGGSPITNYTIYRGTMSGSETFLVKLGDILTYTDSGLTNGVTYYYTVAAINGVGHGPNSTEVNATPATTPSEPLNVTLSVLDETIVVNWSPPQSTGGSPILEYRIYRTSSNDTEILLTTYTVTDPSHLAYADTIVERGETYRYRVSAVSAIGEGPKSSEVSATVPPITSPPKSVFEETWFWIVVAVVVAVLVAVMVLIMRRKKEKQEAATPPEEEEQVAEEQNQQE